VRVVERHIVVQIQVPLTALCKFWHGQAVPSHPDTIICWIGRIDDCHTSHTEIKGELPILDQCASEFLYVIVLLVPPALEISNFHLCPSFTQMVGVWKN